MVLAMLMPAAVPVTPKGTNSAIDAPGVFTFTVISDVSDHAKDVAPMCTLLNAVDVEHPTFVVHLGNLKGRGGVYFDTLLEARHDLFDSLIAPVIYIPGDHNWSDCQYPTVGSLDLVGRLLRLCELFYPDNGMLDQYIMIVMRQSDQAKSRSYRENIHWTMSDVLLVTLNMPGNSNSYKIAGGRNGEYGDRFEVNRQWLARAFTAAHQRKMTGIVIVMQAGSLFEDGWERRHVPNLFDGLLHRRSRDGCLALKRQVRSLTHDYDSAVLLIHDASQAFMFNRPLKDGDDRPDAYIIRAHTYGSSALSRWLEVSIMPGRVPLFHIRSRRLDNTPAPTPETVPAPA